MLSFSEYLDEFAQHPYRHSRDAARYLRDCFEFYGTYEVERPWGELTRFTLFDLEFERDEGLSAERLPGRPRDDSARVLPRALQLRARGPRQSPAPAARSERQRQEHVRRVHDARARALLQAARGRALSLLLDLPARHRRQDHRLRLARRRPTPRRDLRAPPRGPHRREDAQPDARAPAAARAAAASAQRWSSRLTRLTTSARRRPLGIARGQLGQKNRQIFEALLTAYRGDLARVLAHVQVERYTISRRYRTGAVTIGPQMAVDASERQITADTSLGALPASLSSLTLFEPYGELVDASGGMIEYSDLLKRPLDAWKYLLLAIETGEVSLHVLHAAHQRGDDGELQRAAPERVQGAPRLPLVPRSHSARPRALPARLPAGAVPSTTRRSPRRCAVHVAPHATYVAALWAVLSRLRRAEPERYADRQLGQLAADLTPIEKAELYADGITPKRLGADETLRLQERHRRDRGRGRAGRGLRGPHRRLAARDAHACCSMPRSTPTTRACRRWPCSRAFARCAEAGDYGFLRETPSAGYHDHAGFIEQVRERWLDRVDTRVPRLHGPRRGGALRRAVRPLHHARLALDQERARLQPRDRQPTKTPTAR